MMAAARKARETLTRSSTPVRSRVGASARHGCALRADVPRAGVDARQSRTSVLNRRTLRGGSDVPARHKRRPVFGRRPPSQGASLPPRESTRRPTHTVRGAVPVLFAKLQSDGDNAGCLGRDIADIGRGPLCVPAVTQFVTSGSASGEGERRHRRGRHQ